MVQTTMRRKVSCPLAQSKHTVVYRELFSSGYLNVFDPGAAGFVYIHEISRSLSVSLHSMGCRSPPDKLTAVEVKNGIFDFFGKGMTNDE